MGALAGVMEAQYDVLRKNGHSPSEAFNETVEELTQSLIRLVDENGMDWMFSNCSATAQRGALDWAPKFKKATAARFSRTSTKPSRTRTEAKRVLRVCGAKNYKERLDRELQAIHDSEMWQAGAASRSLRPKGKAKEIAKGHQRVSAAAPGTNKPAQPSEKPSVIAGGLFFMRIQSFGLRKSGGQHDNMRICA
jgi:ketol-acid reductoisomerase